MRGGTASQPPRTASPSRVPSTEDFGQQPWEWQGQEELRLYAANVTSWSDQTKIYLEYMLEADIVGISEHHLAATRIPTAKKQLSRAGWCSTFSPAIATEKGGTTAGTAVLWKTHLCCKPLALGTAGEAQGRLSFVSLRVKGCALTFASVYLIPGEGTGSANQALLAELGSALQAKMGAPG